MKKKLLIVACALFFAVLVAACGTPGANNSAAVSKPAATEAPAAPPKMYNVGDTVQVGGIWQVTVTKTKVTELSSIPQGDQIWPDMVGKNEHFLGVYLKVKNISNKEQDLAGYQFGFQDDQGNSNFTEAIMSNDNGDGVGVGGKIEQGMQQQGDYEYEVPISTHTYYLSFQADMLAPGQTMWKISA